MHKLRLGVTVGVLAGLALVAAGCGSSNKSGNTTASASASAVPTQAQSSALAGQVPAKYTSKGTLTAGSDAAYAPNEFIDHGKVVGMDVDLITALTQKLGLKVKVTNTPFDGILPGLASGRYDIGISSFTDTKEREKTVDFVTYFSAGTTFFTKSTGPDVKSLADLCGHKVANERGTTQAADATAQDKKCKAAGKPGVTQQVYPDQTGANLALNAGRADLSMADSPVADYQVKQSNGTLKATGVYGAAPYGIAVPKGSGLAPPLLAALKQLQADGTYKQILDKWGLASGSLANPAINGAQS